MDANLTVDELVLAYRNIRDAKQEREAKYKDEMKELNTQLSMIEAKLLDICNTQGVDGLRAKTGSVTRRTVTRYWTSDWESMYQFIKEHDAYHLLEQRLSNGNMREFLEENPNLMPAGLNADTKYAITVRKPTNK